MSRESYSPQRSKLRARDVRNDEDEQPDAYGHPPDGAWVNDSEDATTSSSEGGGVSIVESDLEQYRYDEANA